VVGAAEAALEVSRRALHEGVFSPAIRPPTVPDGQARLRITLTALHTEAQVDMLVRTLARICAPVAAPTPAKPAANPVAPATPAAPALFAPLQPAAH
jgi:8-amino-7-oxononanoate synthase